MRINVISVIVVLGYLLSVANAVDETLFGNCLPKICIQKCRLEKGRIGGCCIKDECRCWVEHLPPYEN
ncbi:unnamed protein product [Bursaphelenchus xylophilus]|uniref:(pine wood nematode) hypothetical protein n=1 Tax=Bursaphelenchus xylophilus TaxID=6326 RepID=A0A1I7SBM4_BURXY|nr:unnamed protein product [Bursaphelenchus xylophilus]CAG9114482.1 unnamed protein product [Bursaphelenchus xylophilus]